MEEDRKYAVVEIETTVMELQLKAKDTHLDKIILSQLDQLCYILDVVKRVY